jgi:hypothetical protein
LRGVTTSGRGGGGVSESRNVPASSFYDGNPEVNDKD